MKGLQSLVLIFIFVCLCFDSQAESLGWRTDGSGVYPKENPPIEWEEGKNVIWKTDLPDWSNASPVIVNDKIFVCSEPSTLFCISAKDGKVLWQKTESLDSFFSEQGDKNAKANGMKAQEIRKKINALENKARKLKREIKKNPGKETELKSQINELTNQRKTLQNDFKPLEKYIAPPTHQVTGYSSATPACDGKNVYMIYGSGITVCYTMGGSRVWSKFVKTDSPNKWGHCSSPIIVKEKIIIQAKELVALDKNTGKELWKTRSKATWGTPCPLSAGENELLIVPNGGVFNVEDGVQLKKVRLPGLQYNGPIVSGQLIYTIQSNCEAIKISGTTLDTIKAEKLWKQKICADRYYASAVHSKGLIYAYPARKNELSVLDATNGEIVYKQKIKLKGVSKHYF